MTCRRFLRRGGLRTDRLLGPYRTGRHPADSPIIRIELYDQPPDQVARCLQQLDQQIGEPVRRGAA